MEIVTSARVVCRSRLEVAAIPPVVDLIASFLAPPTSLTVEKAIQRGYTRLARHLLDQLEADPSLHHLVKRAQAREFLVAAAGLGDISLLEHLVTRFGCCVDASAIAQAVQSGHLEALQWLYDRALACLAPDQDVDMFKKDALTPYLAGLAGTLGNLEMLQWMQRTRGDVAADQVLQGAAERGHLHVVEWVFPMLEMPISDSSRLVETAMYGGHTGVIAFLHSKSVLPLTSTTMDTAVHYDVSLELLQWMYDNDGEGCTDQAVDNAASNGNLVVLGWLLSKGLAWTARAMDEAAGNDQLEVVKFLHEQKRKDGFRHSAFGSAVLNNHLDVAQYLFEHGCRDFAVVSIDAVASKGGLETIKWLQINYPVVECSVQAMDNAAANGHLDIVKFLHDKRTEGCTTAAIDRAAKNGHLDVVKWLHLNRTEGCTTKAMDDAANNGHLEVVKFLHSHRSEGCTTDAMDYAHDLEILKWLDENRPEGFTMSALSNASMRGDVGMLQWLREHTPVEMWLLDVAVMCSTCGHVEALEWFIDTFPTLVDIQVLMTDFPLTHWWIWSWLKQRPGM